MLADEIVRVWKQNYEVYGVRKVWRQLHREGFAAGRDRVQRLMKALGIAGVRRAKKRRTTVADAAADRADDLVQRSFWAHRPNQLWVADLT